MEKRTITCTECPVGCRVTVEKDGDNITSVVGNGCPRGDMYARNEITCPKRVVTSTVRTADGRIVPVKTDAPIKKSDIFTAMKKINAVRPNGDIKIGDVLSDDVCGAKLVATDNSPYYRS